MTINPEFIVPALLTLALLFLLLALDWLLQ